MPDLEKSGTDLTTMNAAHSELPLRDLENAARGSLVKISPSKLRLIRVFEAIAFPIVRVLDRLQPARAGTEQEPHKILVVEYWNLGDIVMILPFLQNLRIHYPGAHIALMANPKVLPLLQGQGLVDEMIPVRVPWAQHFSRWRKYNPFSARWFELVRDLLMLRKQQFDLALSGRVDVRDNFILWLSGARRRVGYAFAGGRFFLTDVAIPNPKYPHLSDLWLGLFKPLGRPALDQLPRLRLTPQEEECAKQHLLAHGIRNGELIIGVHPGARIPTRQWGIQNFRAVADRLLARFPVKILWFHDPNDRSTLVKATDGLIPDALPLRQFMAVLSRCQFLICNDSGPMHIATALGVPVVAIFGPGEPAWWRPLGGHNRLVIHHGFWCRPCSDRCIFDQPYCLKTISVDDVFTAAAEVIRGLCSNMPAEAQDDERARLRLS